MTGLNHTRFCAELSIRFWIADAPAVVDRGTKRLSGQGLLTPCGDSRLDPQGAHDKGLRRGGRPRNGAAEELKLSRSAADIFGVGREYLFYT